MEFHKTCKTLSIYSFNEILRTNDLRNLVKEYDEFEEEKFKLGLRETVEARAILKEIIFEYSALTANRNMLQKYLSEIAIQKEDFRFEMVDKILKNYEEFGEVEVLEILNKLETSFDIEGDIEGQIIQVLRMLKRLKTKISLMKIKHDSKFNKPIQKRLDEEVIDNLDEQAIMLAIDLKIGYEINTRKTSVSKWINMMNVANKINKSKTHSNG